MMIVEDTPLLMTGRYSVQSVAVWPQNCYFRRAETCVTMPLFRIILSLILCTSAANGVKRLLKVDRLEICDKSESIPLELKDMRIKSREGDNDAACGAFEVPVQINKFKIVVSVVRCLSKEALDTCIPFTTLNPVNTCMLLHISHPAWAESMKSFQPPLSCPLKPGTYTVTDFSIDAELFNLFALEDFYWRGNLTYIALDKYMSLYIDFRVVRYVN